MLRPVLRANAASCAIFGAIFAFAGAKSAAFIGSPPVLLLQILGVGLMLNAAALVWTSLRAEPDRPSVLTFALGDAIWVIATFVLLFGQIWITTPQGILWSLIVAAFVCGCGVLQWKYAPDK